MTEAENTLEIRMMETPPITCRVRVEDFKRLYRAILVWNDPVRLDLDVLEPGRGPGGPGHINRTRPNSDGSQGIGELDVSIAGTEDGGSGQSSYVIPTCMAPDSHPPIPTGAKVRFALSRAAIRRDGGPHGRRCQTHPYRPHSNRAPRHCLTEQ